MCVYSIYQAGVVVWCFWMCMCGHNSHVINYKESIDGKLPKLWEGATFIFMGSNILLFQSLRNVFTFDIHIYNLITIFRTKLSFC